MQNWRADVIGLASSQGGLVDHVRYSPYGVPTRLNPVDIADDAGNALSSSSGANGGVNEGDYNFFFNEYINGNPALDIASAAGEIFPGGDGVVDSGDYNLFFNEFFVTYARGQLTADSVANRLGYAGYEFDPVLIGSGSGAAASDPTCFYHVRHRVYDSQNGRWTRRDPLGYVDGMGLYEYCRSQPIRFTDSSGLECEKRTFHVPWPAANRQGEEWNCTGDCWAVYGNPGTLDPYSIPTGLLECLAGCAASVKQEYYDWLPYPHDLKGAHCSTLCQWEPICTAQCMKRNLDGRTMPSPTYCSDHLFYWYDICLDDYLSCMGIPRNPIPAVVSPTIGLVWSYCTKSKGPSVPGVIISTVVVLANDRMGVECGRCLNVCKYNADRSYEQCLGYTSRPRRFPRTEVPPWKRLPRNR